MKRLALITAFYPPQVGGIETYLEEFVRAYPGDIVVITPHEPLAGSLPARARMRVIPFFSPRPMFPSWLPLIWRLRRILREEHCEYIVLGHFGPYAPGVALLARLLHLPWATFLHGVDFFQWSRNPVRAWVRRVTLRSAARCIANGNFLADATVQSGIPRENIIIASPGVDPNIYYRERPKRFFLENDLIGKRVLLSVGRLIPRKGFDMSIRAFSSIRKEVPSAELVILGDGPERAHLMQLAEECGVAPYVRFLGNVTDDAEKRHWYSAAECFIMPTHTVDRWDTESFGIVFVEALACGTPVVASALGGVREIVENGRVGFLTGDGTSPEPIAESLLAILQSPQTLERFRERARDSVIPRYTWGHQFSKLMTLWMDE